MNHTHTMIFHHVYRALFHLMGGKAIAAQKELETAVKLLKTY